jgi:hypothetical protein
MKFIEMPIDKGLVNIEGSFFFFLYQYFHLTRLVGTVLVVVDFTSAMTNTLNDWNVC